MSSKAPEGDEEDIQEAAVSLAAAAKEISVNAAAVTVYQTRVGIFIITEIKFR